MIRSITMTTVAQPLSPLPGQSKGALSSVLGMVSTIANTVSSTFDAVGGGATILNGYVAKAQTDQSDAHKIHRKVYRSNLITRAALEQTNLKIEVDTHLQANPQAAEQFASVHKELSDLFAEA
jgi:hypothetical protein